MGQNHHNKSKEEFCCFILKRELEARKERNPAYSLRAFAQYLGLGPASLSEVFQGKRDLSPKNKEKIIEKLHLSPQEALILTKKDKSIPLQNLERLLLEENKFQMIADWYHYAILEITFHENHKATPNWAAGHLGITPQEAKAAIERLIKLEYLKIENKKFIKTVPSLTTTVATPSRALRKHHKQILEIAIEAMEETSIDERQNWEITMAIDKKNIPKAKEMMIKAARQICQVLEDGKQEDSYCLSLNLFPLKRF